MLLHHLSTHEIVLLCCLCIKCVRFHSFPRHWVGSSSNNRLSQQVGPPLQHPLRTRSPDGDGIEHDSFYTLVKAGKVLWTDEFCALNQLGFNIIALELETIPIFNEIGALVPDLLSWDDIMLCFISL